MSLRPAHIRIKDGSQRDGQVVQARIEADGFALTDDELVFLPNEYEEVQRPVFATVNDRRAVPAAVPVLDKAIEVALTASEEQEAQAIAGKYAWAFDLDPEDLEW